MRNPFIKVVAAATVGALLALPGVALAQPPEAEETPVPMFRIPGSTPEPDRTNRKTGLTERTFNIITSIFEDIGEEKFAEALERLQALSERRGLSDFEEAMVHRYLGYTHAMLGNNEAAIRETNIALDAEVLPHADTQQALLMIGSLHATEGEWDATLRAMSRYFYWEAEPPFNALQIMTVAFTEKEDYRNAIIWAERAIEVSDEPREDMYRIKLFAHNELKQYEEAADTLAQMIAIWPDEAAYWEQLASILMELGREDDSLAVYAVAYQQGLLPEGNKHLNLARYYLYHEAPYNAARILKKGLDEGVIESTQENWELTSQAFQMAQENEEAIAALQKAAALSEDGELFVREAMLHSAVDNWEGVERAARAALDKGGLEHPGRAWMWVGMAAFEQGNRQDAIRALREATEFEETRKGAQQWVNYINNTIRQERALRQGT